MPSPKNLRREIAVQFQKLERTVEEIDRLRQDVGDEQPTIREKAAAGQFLGSVYMGIENVFKRILRFLGKEPPSGPDWHTRLLGWFGDEPRSDLPVLVSEELANRLKPFLRFRHLVTHGYALDLEWNRMREGLEEARPVFEAFRTRVEDYLDSLDVSD